MQVSLAAITCGYAACGVPAFCLWCGSAIHATYPLYMPFEGISSSFVVAACNICKLRHVDRIKCTCLPRHSIQSLDGSSVSLYRICGAGMINRNRHDSAPWDNHIPLIEGVCTNSSKSCKPRALQRTQLLHYRIDIPVVAVVHCKLNTLVRINRRE
jgi:hypothetical protein